MIKSVFALLLCLNPIICQLENFVHQGEETSINGFTHAVCLQALPCVASNSESKNYLCGSSILNQKILLTAAHCVYGCTSKSTITLNFGHADRKESKFVFLSKFEVHHEYSEHSAYCDIALLKAVRPLPLSWNVGRIAIYPKRYTPYGEEGKIAGWGYVDEIQQVLSSKMRKVTQKIMTHAKCQTAVGKRLPLGIICGGEKGVKSYVASGDSGSALVVRDYIQVGLVSYKNPSVSRSIAMYTDVGFFYDWITAMTIRLYCKQ